MKVSDLFAEIGFKVDTKGLSDFENSMKRIQKTIKGCISEIKEFAPAADKIARAFATISTLNALSDKDIRSRYRAITSKIRPTAALDRAIISGSKVESTGGSNKLLNFASSVYLFRSAVGILKTAVNTFEKVIKESVQRAFTYHNFSYATGISPNAITPIQAAMERGGTNITGKQVAQSIATLQQQLESIRLGETGYLKPYKMLGIDARGKDPMKVIEELKDSIKHLDNVTATNLLNQIGLGHADWLRYLRGEMKESPFGGMTKLQSWEREDVTNIGLSWKGFVSSLKDFMDTVVVALSVLSPILDGLSAIVDFINVALKPLIAIINAALGMIVGGIEGLGDIIGYWAAELVDVIKHPFGIGKPNQNSPKDIMSNVAKTIRFVPPFGWGLSQAIQLYVNSTDDIKPAIKGTTDGAKESLGPTSVFSTQGGY